MSPSRYTNVIRFIQEITSVGFQDKPYNPLFRAALSIAILLMACHHWDTEQLPSLKHLAAPIFFACYVLVPDYYVEGHLEVPMPGGLPNFTLGHRPPVIL